MAKLLWVLIALACACAADALRVLVVFPLPGKSHTILGEGVVRHLINAGHEVTFITPILNKNPPPKLRQLDVSENWKYLQDVSELLDLTQMMKKNEAMDFSVVYEFMMTISNVTFYYPDVQKVITDPNEHFDVIVAEWMFSEIYSTYSAIFGAPYIWVSTTQPHWMALQLVDEATNPAYTVDMSSPARVPPFSFYERVEQLGYQILGKAMQKFMITPRAQEMYNGLIPFIKLRGNPVPDYETLRFNASLMLGNSHASLGTAIPLPQSYKAVGGYHIDMDVKPLPEDLQKLMDNAKNGVIYFSLGSNLKSKDLPVELKQDLLKMFGSLKQTVLWKFEEALPNLPSNVHILQWAPQTSILAHPNCKLFITHGGLLSTTETVAFGKPIIGIPIFADQFANVDTAVATGYAKRVDLSYTMAQPLKEAILEILNNPRYYAAKVQELSQIFNDRPMAPGAELVYWVEHVVRTRGARHLRSPALDIPFYQKMYLDLAAVILAAYLVLKKVVKRLLRKNSRKVKTN